jgi:D-sedoheptulose 7-phosphate isomerase
MSSRIVATKEEQVLQRALDTSLENALVALLQLKERHRSFIIKCATQIASVFSTGHKVLIAGNGGSLCDAAHFAEELTGIFRNVRPALPALVLSESGHLTCTANDLGYEWIFSRAIEAFGRPKDLFIALSTSGNSLNMIRAVQKAKELGLHTVALLGKDGGKMRNTCELEMCISGFSTSDRIQEAHMAALHMIIELVEIQLFEDSQQTSPYHYASLPK